MRRIFSATSFLLVATFAVSCQKPQEGPADISGHAETVSRSITHEAKLKEYLADTRILRMLKVDEVIILETDTDRVVVGDKVSKRQIGEVYYTIQAGWHLKRDNEKMEHRPGEGWLIWEQ